MRHSPAEFFAILNTLISDANQRRTQPRNVAVAMPWQSEPGIWYQLAKS